MKPRNFYRIVVGIVVFAGGLSMLLLSSGEESAGTVILCAGLAFLITGIIRHKRYGDDPESDERSQKIGAYGLSYAWLTGIIFMFALFLLDCLGILKLSAQNALSASILALAVSAVLYQTYLFRKGDVA